MRLVGLIGAQRGRLVGGFLGLLVVVVLGCSDEPADGDGDTDSDGDGDIDADVDGEAEADTEADGDVDSGDGGNGTPFVVVTFNTGTTEGMPHDDPPDDGYTSAHAVLSDQYYGDGLAWIPAVDATRDFFAEVDPDVVVFQEIFYSEECVDIPEEARVDFVCERWAPGDATVAQVVLGEGYQVMCHPGKPDKCAAVNRRFGTFRGCNTDFCLEGLDGYRVETCGSGARVARGVIDMVEGGSLTLVNFHGSSGVTAEEQQCRVWQVEQVFVDLGDGEPGVNGERHLVMGDLNTDPCRMVGADTSATRWADFVGDGLPFHFISECGARVDPTYLGFINIDHVISDVATGSCWAAGVTGGHPDVIDAMYFDHRPIVCTIQLPGE